MVTNLVLLLRVIDGAKENMFNILNVLHWATWYKMYSNISSFFAQQHIVLYG